MANNYGIQVYQIAPLDHDSNATTGPLYGFSRGTYRYGTVSGPIIGYTTPNNYEKVYFPHPQATDVWIDTIRWYANDFSGGGNGTTIYVRINSPSTPLSAFTYPFTTMYINGIAYVWSNTTTGNYRLTAADGASTDTAGDNAGYYASWKFYSPTNPFNTGSGTYNNIYFVNSVEPTVGVVNKIIKVTTNTDGISSSLTINPSTATLAPGDNVVFSDTFSSENWTVAPTGYDGFDSRIWETTTGFTITGGSGATATKTLRYDPEVLPITDTIAIRNNTTNAVKLLTINIPYPFSATVSPIIGQLGPDVNPYPISTQFTSQAATVAGLGNGLSATATVQTSGLSSIGLSVNGGSFVSSAVVNNGDNVVVRGTTSATYGADSWIQLTLAADNAVADVVYIKNEPDPATGFDDGSAIPFGHATGPIPMSDITKFFAGYPVSDIYTPPYNLGSFYRGGLHVPNMAINTAIPTSGTISYSNFRNSGTVLYFVRRPGTKAVNYNSISAPAEGQTLAIAWYVFDSEWFGTADWEMGYGPYMKWACEYYWEPPEFEVATVEAGACTTPTLTSTTPSLANSGQGQQQGWKGASALNQAGNVGFGITCTCIRETEAIFKGTIRMHVRHPQSTSSELVYDVPFRFNIFGV